jgi:hypothetical protein
MSLCIRFSGLIAYPFNEIMRRGTFSRKTDQLDLIMTYPFNETITQEVQYIYSRKTEVRY